MSFFAETKYAIILKNQVSNDTPREIIFIEHCFLFQFFYIHKIINRSPFWKKCKIRG